MYDDLNDQQLREKLAAMEQISLNQFSLLGDQGRVHAEVSQDLLVALHSISEGMRRIEGAIDQLEKLLKEANL